MAVHHFRMQVRHEAGPGNEVIPYFAPDLTESNPVITTFCDYSEAISCPWDMHYGFELGLVTKGRITKHYNGYDRQLRPGQFWLCGAWEPHGWSMLETPCSLTVMVIWPPMLCRQRYTQSPCLRLYAPFSTTPELRPQMPAELLDKALEWNEYLYGLTRQAETPYRSIRTQLLLIEALLLITERWQPPRTGGNDEVSLDRSISRPIETVLSGESPISTSEAARMAGMSRQTFDRAFRQLMGISFAKFEIRHRIHGAAFALLQTDEPLKAIAYRWGFSDASHFIRRFQELYRCSPTDWRLRSSRSD
jgi:AraC-like DNA-binding protein